MVVSNIVYLHPFLGKWSNLTNIFQMGWNHQLDSNNNPIYNWTLLAHLEGTLTIHLAICIFVWIWFCVATRKPGGFQFRTKKRLEFNRPTLGKSLESSNLRPTWDKWLRHRNPFFSDRPEHHEMSYPTPPPTPKPSPHKTSKILG